MVKVNREVKRARDYQARRERAKADVVNAKLRLEELSAQRKKEIAALAFKAGIEIIPNHILKSAFQKIAEDYHAGSL